MIGLDLLTSDCRSIVISPVMPRRRRSAKVKDLRFIRLSRSRSSLFELKPIPEGRIEVKEASIADYDPAIDVNDRVNVR